MKINQTNLNDCYKILWDASQFGFEFNIDDIYNIEPQTFTAQNTDHPKHNNVCILSEYPVIHFCDNAFDTMLWYNHIVYPMPAIIYQIQPCDSRGFYLKQKSNDPMHLSQCGAQSVRFIKQIPLKTVLDKAIKEFDADMMGKIRDNINVNMPAVLRAWRQGNFIKDIAR